MRRAISLVICVVIAISALSINVFASSKITPRYNNVSNTNTYFDIDSSGNAKVIASFGGDRSAITSATVKIKIQKRFLLVFWNNVIEWTDETTENNYTVVHSTNVGSGTYRATVEYTIYGTGGEPDVIKDEIQRTH